MADNLNVSFKNKWTWPCNLCNAANKENIIQNISQIYTNNELREVGGIYQQSKIYQNMSL